MEEVEAQSEEEEIHSQNPATPPHPATHPPNRSYHALAGLPRANHGADHDAAKTRTIRGVAPRCRLASTSRSRVASGRGSNDNGATLGRMGWC